MNSGIRTPFFFLAMLIALVAIGIPSAKASITLSAGETLALQSNETLSIDGSLSIVSTSSLNATAGGASINLSGDLSNQGTFSGANVTFTGSGASTISGSTSFASLTCQTGGKSLNFEANSTQTITDSFDLDGASAGSLLALRSTVSGTQFILDLQTGHQTASFLDVQDSNLLTSTILPSDSTNSGNNGDNWLFSIRITGRIVEGTSPVAGATVNGGPLGTTVTDANGYFTFDGVEYGSTFTITISKVGYTFSPATFTGTISNHITANSYASVTGTDGPTYGPIVVEVQSGSSGLANVFLDGAYLGTQTTANSGNAIFEAAVVGQSYSITPSRRGYAFDPVTRTGIKADGTTNLSFTASVGAVILGQVLKGNVPVPHATVELLVRNGSGFDTLRTIADANGNYEFPSVPLGTFDVLAKKNGVTVSQVKDFQVSVTGETGLDFSVDELTLAETSYGMWTGFFSTTNILELVNKGTENLLATVSVRSYDGNSNDVARTYTIAPGAQRDVILNDSQDYLSDSYGLVVVETNHSTYDGRVTYYSNSSASGDVTHSVPLTTGITGTSYAPFNTYQPSGNAADFGALVANWLAIGNFENTAQNFDIDYLDREGNPLLERTVTVQPLGRFDVQGGHEIPGARNVGLISVSPHNNYADYSAVLSRYAFNGSGSLGYAFSIAAGVGSVAEQIVPIGAVGTALHAIELANLSDSANDTRLSLYNHSGTLIRTIVMTLPAKSQRHYVFSELDLGSAIVDPSSSVFIGGAIYYKDGTGAISAAEYSPGVESLGSKHNGSFNVFLGMHNWLRLLNASDQRITVTLNTTAADNTPVAQIHEVAPHGRRDIPIHQLIGSNAYGPVTLTTDNAGELSAQMLRTTISAGGTSIETSCPTTVR